MENRVTDLLSGANVSTQPAEVSPDRALVFEVIGPVGNFVAAARSVGLEWLAEDYGVENSLIEDDEEPEDSEYDEASSTGMDLLYVTMPSIGGLQRIISLYKRFVRGEKRPKDDGDWWSLFGYLSDVRTWSAQDRVDPLMKAYVERRLSRYPDRPVRVELDLWFRENPDLRSTARSYVEALMAAVSGTVLDFATIEPIRYQAALVELSGEQARNLVGLHGPVAQADKVMRVRPQSLFSTGTNDPASDYDDDDRATPPSADPRAAIVALLDGYPIQNHELLANRVDIEELDVTGSMSPVSRRFHGTAMASLILHGDLGSNGQPIDRVLKVVPILAAPQGLNEECTPQDKLPIAMVYRAVVALIEGLNGSEPLGERVVIVNHSVCDLEAPFVRGAGSWAKLIDYLSYRYDILFIVSAGNPNPPFFIDTYTATHSFNTANSIEREIVLLRAIEKAKGTRSILSPAEAVNALTVGAVHEDGSLGCPATFVDPFAASGVTNIASGVGLGVNRAIKPDLIEAGGRQLAAASTSSGVVSVWAQEHGEVGQLAAAPDPTGGTTNKRRRSSGTSNAAALVTRSAVRIADVIEQTFADTGEDWVALRTRAVVLKALLTHGSRWGDTGILLKSVYEGTWQRQRETISRFLGYGRHNLSRTLRADGSRITLLADDVIEPEERHEYVIPIPRAMIGNRELRRIVMTLAWSSPVDPTSNRYRGVSVEIVDANGKRKFWKGVKGTLQPHPDATRRGTLQHLVLEGKNIIREAETGLFKVGIQARAVLPAFESAEVPYALAITLELAEPVRTDIFDDISLRVWPKQRVAQVTESIRVTTRAKS